jgi:siroheme synthase
VVVRALEGREVVRVKGGDPMVFGRGGEEAEELAAARVPFELVPGISAALGAAASTGIPLTHRDVASSVTFATAHAATGEVDLDLATHGSGTIVFYMGLGRMEVTCASLIAGGRRSDTPAAVVSRATRPDQRVVVGTIADIAARARAQAVEAPALLLVGEVVAHRTQSTESSATGPAALASAMIPGAPGRRVL